MESLTPDRISEPSNEDTFCEANLLYYFWLPAGKDEFGFEAQDHAPLVGAVSYKSPREQTIARTFRQQSEWLARNHGSIGGLRTSGSLEPQDAELGLRKLHFPFKYDPIQAILGDVIERGPIEGTAIILSNGLYLWSFRVKYRPDASDGAIKNALLRFIKEDFVENCVSRLFGFDYVPESRVLSNEYEGILTYYQLDLLFNGLFDTDAHPKKFFDRKSVEPYMIRDVIRSASLYGFKQKYQPLWDLRGDYSQRGAMAADQPMVDTDIDLTAEHLRDAAGEDQEERELLLSRLSFSAMEQFIRVLLPFGLANYKAGLDHCRLDLIEDELMLRRNQASSDFRRPSLQANLPMGDIEAYFLLLSAKLPTLTFFRDLIEDMIEVTHPLHLIPENRDEWTSRKGWEEWRESRSTLAEAEDQLTRQVAAIRAELEAIQAFLTMSQADAVRAELAEARKLNEIEVEDPRHSVTLASRDWDQLIYLLTILAVVLAAFQAYSGLGVWLTDVLLHNDVTAAHIPWWHVLIAVGQWLLVALALFLFYWYRYKSRRKTRGQGDAKLTRPVRLVPNIFDCAFPRENMRGEEIEELVNKLQLGSERLIDVSTKQPELELASISTFREAIPGTAERIKYSIESAPNNKGISYTLHLEVDRQPSESREHSEQLRNVRMVVRIPAKEPLPIDNVRYIVQYYASLLILPSPQSGAVREYFQRRFGWSVS
jgi:hypothetical protein